MKEDARKVQARSLRTPAETLIELARDENEELRKIAAENPHLPVDILIELSRDENLFVRNAVARRRDLPLDTLLEMANEHLQLVSISALIRRSDSPYFGFEFFPLRKLLTDEKALKAAE